MGNLLIVPLLHSMSNKLRNVFAYKQEDVTGDWLVYPSASVLFEFKLRTKQLLNVKNALYQLP